MQYQYLRHRGASGTPALPAPVVSSLPFSSSRAWAVLALLWGCAALNYVDRLLLTTMRSSLRAALPMSDAQFGLLSTVFLVVYALGSPVAGFIADKVGRTRVIVGSLAAWSLLTLATAWVTSYEQLLVTRVLLAIAQTAAMPASVALVVDYHRDSSRSLASGLLLSGAMSGAALAGLGGWLAERYDWTYAFQLFGWLGLGYALLLGLFLRDVPVETTTNAPASPVGTAPVGFGAALAHLFTNGGYLLLLGVACTLGIVGWSIVGWMPTFMQERFALTQGDAGLATTICLNVAALAGMLAGGAWAGRWSRRNPRAPVLVGMIGVAIATPAVLLLAHAPTLQLGLAGLAVYGFFRYFSDANLMPTLCLYVDPRYRATSWGLSTLFSSTIGGLGIYAAGALRDRHVDATRIFHFGVANLVVCAVILLILSRRTPTVSPA